MRTITYGAIRAELAHVDDPDALERAETSLALQSALELSRPRNWWGSGVDPERAVAMARSEGIPIVWVPPAAVLTALIDASDETTRHELLLANREPLIDACQELLDECTEPELHDTTQLAKAALRALAEGHDEASLALSVSLGEPLAVWASTPRVRFFDSDDDRKQWESDRKKSGKYGWAAVELSRLQGDPGTFDIPYIALLAPIPTFFTPWYPQTGQPAPAQLSRHVVAHQATLAHFSEVNAILALMLVTSILREQEEWALEVREMD